MLSEAGGTGAGVSVEPGTSFEAQVVDMADQVQGWAFEALNAAGFSATWPECPYHPNSHPLSAAIVSSRPAWWCPKSERVVAVIGGLAGSDGL
jgi:hypothetical protein